MGATYLSLQLRMTDREAAIAGLQSIAAANAAAGLQFYVTESIENWLAVFPNLTPRWSGRRKHCRPSSIALCCSCCRSTKTIST